MDLTSISTVSGIDTDLLEFLTLYGDLAVLVSSFLIMETAMVAASALSALGYLSFWDVLIFATIGSVLADVFWYYTGPFLIRRFPRWKKKEREYMSLPILKKIDRHLFLTLILLQFFYGGRLFIIIYMGIRRIPILLFIGMNLVSTALLVTVLYGVGWLIGKGTVNLFPYFKGTTLLLTAIAASIAATLVYRHIFKSGLGKGFSD